MFLSALDMMKTTDVSHAPMIAFQAGKQMLRGSLYHEGHVMHHSFPSCHHDPAVAYDRQESPKNSSSEDVFLVICVFFAALQLSGRGNRMSLFCQISTATLLHSRGLQM